MIKKQVYVKIVWFDLIFLNFNLKQIVINWFKYIFKKMQAQHDQQFLVNQEDEWNVISQKTVDYRRKIIQ